MDAKRRPTLVVTGLGRENTAERIRNLAGPEAIITTMTDVEGALAVRDGRADYLVGVCQSGAGGALAMAVAFLGRERCATLATMGHGPSPDDVKGAIRGGKVAFGVSTDQVDATIRLLVPGLLVDS